MAVSSSSTLLIIGVVVTSGIAYWTLSNSSKSISDYEVEDIEDDDDDGEESTNGDNFITAEEIVKIFDKLFLELQSAFSQLMQQVQQIQMTGQMIPEKQLKTLIRGELERALTVKQKQIIEDQFDIDPSCCEEATWEFVNQQHPAVCKAVERFQKLWENATGEPVTGWKPGQDPFNKRLETAATELLEADETIAAAETYFNALTECMRTLVSEYKAAGKDLKNPMVQQELNTDFSTKVTDAGEEALEAIDVTMNQFEASVKLHANNPTVGRALGMMQLKQQQEMMAMAN